jgi:hypothetical protein
VVRTSCILVPLPNATRDNGAESDWVASQCMILMESEYVVWLESVKRRAVDCALHISGLSYSGGESRDEDYEQGRGGGRELH